MDYLVSWLYGRVGNNFVKTIIRIASEKESLKVVNDQIGTPTHTKHFSESIIHLLKSNYFGLYHFSDDGECSWYEFACEIVSQMKTKGLYVKVKEIIPISTSQYPTLATRPNYSVLSKDKFKRTTHKELRHWKDNLNDFFNLY